ncbi:formyltetrahydrofolate deformylase [Cryobacterium psychrophilum]|uniref:Formyltetrahydrofolate deformylase n=1 Tax=Cryobacterium psychrophilum TaxID=41988 RepID=A0A4Y8KS45_9MICO|nr:formyltetrahydrofolate deformylase [Cryobacterium psychrophilum]TDW29442.1 formyltetrahydrofolate deformylase [Cryobacterium psychrophilum]TFD81420.1 formyltetrahydrofolate deformylase [Cryobacterium psychrophilum]
MSPNRKPGREYILTLSCQDGPGLVHEVAGFLVRHHANIISSQQLDDRRTGQFFMRVQFDFTGSVPPVDELSAAFTEVADRRGMAFNLVDSATPTRTLIMVSRFGHCLNDLLYRYRLGTLNIEIPVIVSNHPDFASLAASYDVEYRHLPVTPETKAEMEATLLNLIDLHEIDLVVLARYMQILSPETSHELSGRAINIHHSFLPSFKGAKPYHQAHERGVKLIGATAHYVNDDLDEGPIIEQDVVRVDHGFGPEDLVAAGRDVETQVLSRAVQWHSERRVFPNGSRTVVFR